MQEFRDRRVRMIDLSQLTAEGRKLWVKRKWDEYMHSRNTKAIRHSVRLYEDPTHEKLECMLDLPKWKSTVDKKVNYLLARPPVCDAQEELDALSDVIRETAKQFLLRGSLIWIVQGDGKSPVWKPAIMSNTIAVYADENKEEAAAYIRFVTDVRLDEQTGTEEKVELYECYYITDGVMHRDTFCYSNPEEDKEETIVEDTPLIIELGRTGDAPLFGYLERIIEAFDHIMRHQDATTEANTKPLIEVRGYSGTDEEDIRYAVEELGVVKTDGNGGVNIHSRSMDSSSIDLWARRLSQEFCEAACIVSKDNELQYAMSGKAMDRLFVDMDNDAKALAHVLERALIQYFEFIGVEAGDIVWNTDRPVDDASIINAIIASRGLLSDKTLIEQHPWVDDVDEEMKRKEEENNLGVGDLVDTEEF